jgi:thiamine pyrophosphokinase
MKTALIILNGECKDYTFLKELSIKTDYIICADGGYNHAMNAGITPDLILGDFDSSIFPENVSAEIKVYPVKKDMTDGEIAINEAKSRGFNKIILTCALGGRQDHTLANLMLLDENIIISEKTEEVNLTSKDFYLNVPVNTIFSIIPVEKSNISINGAVYSLENKDVMWGSSLTLSNVSSSETVEIKVKYGKILIFVNK